MLIVALVPVAGFAAQDTTPPVITKVEMDKTVASEGERFTITVYASDDSGFPEGNQAAGSVQLVQIVEPPEDNPHTWMTVFENKGDGKLVATFNVHEHTHSGEYKFSYITIIDKNGNKTSITPDKDPQKLIQDVRFTIKTSLTDSTMPKIQKVEAKSQTLKPGDSFSIKVYATDESGMRQMGEDGSGVVYVSQEGYGRGEQQEATLFDNKDGSLTATFHVTEAWKTGEYTISWIYLEDYWRNARQIINNYAEIAEISDYVFTVIDKNASSAPPRRPFEDVPVGTWYTGAVKYVTTREYMSGTGNYKFSPDATVTRGMIAQILYAAEGKPAVSGGSKFTDVKAGKWYADAVNWAAGKGLVSGYGNGQFKPEAPITREQMVAILYKYAEMKGYDLTAKADLSKYPDQAKISKWAVTAVKWGVDHGIISGTDKGIEPQGNATRAQIAVILRAFDRLRP